jgi:hypothetical protein
MKPIKQNIMKKLLFLALSLLVLSCGKDNYKSELTIECRLSSENLETIPEWQIISLFDDLDFYFEDVSLDGFLESRGKMLLAWDENGFLYGPGKFSWVDAKHNIAIFDEQKESITITNVKNGKYCITMWCNGYIGYRKVVIDKKTKNNIQKFVFDENDYGKGFLEK